MSASSWTYLWRLRRRQLLRRPLHSQDNRQPWRLLWFRQLFVSLLPWPDRRWLGWWRRLMRYLLFHFSRALFSLWSASCCATEHIFWFDIPIQEALYCAYASFSIAKLEGAQLVTAACVETACSFLLALFCWWSASCRATCRTEHLLPEPFQRRSYGRRH